MKINSNQVGPNYNGITGSATAKQASAPKQEKLSEAVIKDAEYNLKSETEMDEKRWIEVIERANKAIESNTCSFEFSIHEQTKQIIVKVIDNETREVIREFPPEKILDMVAKMWEVAGIMVDERR